MYDIFRVTSRTSPEATYEVQRQFLGMMSHELRTPMQSVLGYTALLLGGYHGPLTDEQRQDLRDIQAGAERLLSLFEQMLDLSHIHACELALNIDRVELEQYLRQVRDAFADQAAEKGLALSLDVPRELPAVRGDPVRIYQILHILIENAIKFTESGWVQVRAEVLEEEVTVAVQDTGIGIAPEGLSSIFVPFRQGDSSSTRNFGGAGIGLALAHELSRLMDARIDVESQPGEGTTFTLRFPTSQPKQLAQGHVLDSHCP